MSQNAPPVGAGVEIILMPIGESEPETIDLDYESLDEAETAVAEMIQLGAVYYVNDDEEDVYIPLNRVYSITVFDTSLREKLALEDEEDDEDDDDEDDDDEDDSDLEDDKEENSERY